MADKQIAELEGLGYQVSVASEGSDDYPDVLSISGFGITNLMVKANDTEALDRLLCPEAHHSRELQEKGDVAPEELFKADLDAQVALGEVSREDADAAIEAASADPDVAVSAAVLEQAISSLPDGPLTRDDLIKAFRNAETG